MRKLMVVAGLLLTVGVAQADIADREHNDATTATILEAISALSEQVAAQGTVSATAGECPTVQVPTTFRLCRQVRGMERCSRKYLKAVE